MVSEAFAMAGNGAQQGNPYSGIIMLVIMFAIFYFLLIRPQQKRAKQHREMIEALKVGDMVVTAGGIHGQVSNLTDTTVTIEVDKGVKLKLNRASIANKKME